MKTTKQKTNDPKVTFTTLLSNYATAYNDRTYATSGYASALTDLATAVTYSVLKKCINTGYNSTLVSIRAELGRDRNMEDRRVYADGHAYRTTYNADGDRMTKIVDSECVLALTEISRSTYGDGVDLVNDAIVAILEETAKQTERDPDLPIDLERPYTVRRLKQKVWIKSADSMNGWETVETAPIREIFKAVRRAINNSRAACTDPRNGYSYLEDISTDPESEETCEIYRRLSKYADLGGYATDFNGACTLYTVDVETVDRYDELIASLKLTKKQATILTLKQSGRGNKAIATYLGITENSVKGAMNEIKRKARNIGLDPKNK